MCKNNNGIRKCIDRHIHHYSASLTPEQQKAYICEYLKYMLNGAIKDYQW